MPKYIDVNIFPDMEDGFLFCHGKDYISLKRLRSFIKAIPTADVEEVVRCGECIHWNAETKGCKRNPSVYRWYAKDFCSNGVR